MLHQFRPDNETFRLDVITVPSVDTPPVRKILSLTRIREQLAQLDGHDDEDARHRRAFLCAVGILHSGERHQRHLQQRKTATGTRNIRLVIRQTAEFLEQTLSPESIGRGSNKRTKSEQMRIEELTTLIHEIFAPIKQRLGLPLETPMMYSYVIPEAVINRASEGCRSYLARIKTRQPLTMPAYHQVCTKLRRDFAQDAEGIIEGMERGREHLSAISMNSTDGQMIVSIVNQRGDMVSMEGWKLLRLIDEHDTALELGTLDRRGNWEPKPILAFNNNTSGAIIALYTGNDSTLQVICRQDTVTNSGGSRKGIPDKAVFILDQDYLVSVYVAIAQLKNDKKRFEELREAAEARKAVNIEDFFDPGLFET